MKSNKLLTTLAKLSIVAVVLITGCKKDNNFENPLNLGALETGMATMSLGMNVHYVSSSGSDLLDGLTQNTAWRTLKYAESQATSPDDTIALKKGDTFITTAALAIWHGGTSGHPITWDGNLWGSGAAPIIYTNFNAGDAPVYHSAVNIRACSNVKFQNITVDVDNHNLFGIVIGGSQMYSAAPPQNSETNINIYNCSVLDCGSGNYYCLGILIQTWNNNISDIIVQACNIDGVGAEALSIYPGRRDMQDGTWATPSETSNVYFGYNTISNFGRSGSLGEGIQINNKATNVIVEHNYITTGTNGSGFGLVIESNEPTLGYFPTGIIIRYNKINITETNKFCIFMQHGQAKTANVYYNLLIQGNNVTDTDGGAIWVGYSGYLDSPTWAGASLKFYNNTIYTLSGRSFQSDCATTGVVELKNNVIYNTATESVKYTYPTCCIMVSTGGSLTHSNNSIYRSAGVDYQKVVDGVYYFSNADVLNYEATAQPTNPLLITPGSDYHLQAGSPCINTGVNVGLTKDFNQVTIGNPPNIGAFENL